MRFCTVTLGCKANQFDTQTIEGILARRGHVMVKLGDGCAICVINTCAVTAESVRKSRQAVRRVKRLEPEALIAVCGCFSELEPEIVASIGADLIGGTDDREPFALEVEKAAQNAEMLQFASGRVLPSAHSVSETKDGGAAPTCAGCATWRKECDDGDTLPDAKRSTAAKPRRTRALLKIQDGCDNYCAYCVIPFARGRSRSTSLKDIIRQAKNLELQGFKEIVITGIEISAWQSEEGKAHQQPKVRLTDAINAISAAAPGARLRIGSLDPAVLTDEFIESLSEIPNLCNHIHISLQSGCDDTLQRMGRKYNASTVLQSIGKLRSEFQDCGITADLIVGFPGETDKEFKETLEFLKNAAFSAMHIFPFSQRPGTKAADMPNQIKKAVIKERSKMAAKIANEMAMDFKKAQLGKIVEVLFEQEKEGRMMGHSGNYLEVAVRKRPDNLQEAEIPTDEAIATQRIPQKNELHQVKMMSLENGCVIGELF